MKTPHILFFLLITTTVIVPPALAQAYKSQLRYLEQSAVRQYERGDKESALKQFGWILRIEPDNTLARDYLKKIATEPATSPAATQPQRAQEIITDISTVKGDLAAYEQETRELERLIRDLITENDALYQTLYKRSREVTDMRQKFEGTPYGDAYAQTMQGLPMDRVPQRLHPSDDILPENMSNLTQAEQAEVNAILKDIAAIDGQRTSDGALPPGLNATLQAKRDLLVKKTLALAEKRNSLLQLKDQLSGINAGLKNTNSRYTRAMSKIDAYYKRVKDKLAKKNYIEQKMFSELIADYADKLREIEKLKSSVRDSDNSLVAFKPALSSANNNLREIDNTLQAKDDELLKFKAILLQYKEELARRDTVITRQQTDIAMTQRKLDDVSTQITGIEDSLQARHIRTLEVQNGHMAAMLQKNETTLDEALRHIQSLEAQLVAVSAELKKPLSPMNDSEKKALKETLAALKDELRIKQEDLDATNASINALTIREQALLARMKDNEKGMEEFRSFKETTSRLNEASAQEMSALKAENTGLRQNLLDANTQLTARSKELAEAAATIKGLQDALAPKDARIAELSKRAATFEQEAKKLHPTARINKAADTDAEDDLRKRLIAATEKLAATESRVTSLSLSYDNLKETLAQREGQIAQLKAAPAIQESAEKKALIAAVVAKDEELTVIKAEAKMREQSRDKLIAEAVAAKAQELLEVKQMAREQSAKIQTLTDANKELLAAIDRSKTPAPGPEALPQPVAAAEPQDDVRQLTLDLNEKDILIDQLKEDLAAAHATIETVTAASKDAAMNKTIVQIKKDAQEKILSERDTTISRLTTEIDALKKEIAAAQAARQESLASTDAAHAEKQIAEGQLRSRDNEISLMKTRIEDLLRNIKTARTLAEKKDRDHEATLKELRRLSDTLDQKKTELDRLQQRVKNETRRTPAPATPENTKDCGTDCFK